MAGVVRVGFFRGFKGSDTLLLGGNAEGLAKLAGVFQALASGPTGLVRLESLSFVQAIGQVAVLAEQSPASAGLRYAAPTFPRPGRLDPPASFAWRLSAEDWEDVALRVAALVEAGEGHQYPGDYLGPLDDVRVIVAMNEYGDAWWQSLADQVENASGGSTGPAP